MMPVIAGMQKLTLLDYPGKMAAILFLPGCNMRCPFCHNSELIHAGTQNVPAEEILSFLEKRKKLLDGVVITGGEPSLQDIRPLLKEIRTMDYQIKIDTNGLRPDVIESWLNENLADYIAMDIKNSPDKYAITCGHANIDLSVIQESIHIIIHNAHDYEFRTTIIPEFHTPEDFQKIGEVLIPNAEKFFLQPFVSRDTVPDRHLTEPSDELLKQCLSAVRPYVKHAEIRGRDL